MNQGKPNFRTSGPSREAPSLIREAPYKGGDSRISERRSALPGDLHRRTDLAADLRIRLEEKARELGFCAIGFARADAAPASGERLRQWLADGAHGDMIWMEETADRR